MKVHEYQAKEILKRFAVAVPRGEVASTPAEARDAAERLGGRAVLKAQVHAGGRGKGGGIKVAKTHDDHALFIETYRLSDRGFTDELALAK